MCDFAAWSGKITRDELENIGLACGLRNRDATGVSFSLEGSIKTLKGPVNAEKFFKSDKWNAVWEEFGHKASSGMVHSRIATNGNPSNNVNNHPHVSDNGSVLVHKGIVKPVVQMEDAISDCDSEQLLRSLDVYGLEKGLKNVSGWAHIAYIPFYDRYSMYLYSNSSPLELHELEGESGDLAIANTNHLDLNSLAIDHTELNRQTLDLDTWYSLDITTDGGFLDIWKPDMTLNDTHSNYFGGSERAFRSRLLVNH